MGFLAFPYRPKFPPLVLLCTNQPTLVPRRPYPPLMQLIKTRILGINANA